MKWDSCGETSVKQWALQFRHFVISVVHFDNDQKNLTKGQEEPDRALKGFRKGSRPEVRQCDKAQGSKIGQLTCCPAKVGAAMRHVEVDRACAIGIGQDL